MLIMEELLTAHDVPDDLLQWPKVKRSDGAAADVLFPYWLVLISGPPRSGKNRAGFCLSERLGADHFALSNMLKRLTHDYYGLDKGLPPLAFESCKDRACEEFGGLSPREAYIQFSETVLKPREGDDYLGRAGAGRVAANRANARISVVSGVGFIEEIRPLLGVVHGRDALHIQLIKDRVLQYEDSREVPDLSDIGIDEVSVKNTGCGAFLRSLEKVLPGIRLKPARKSA